MNEFRKSSNNWLKLVGNRSKICEILVSGRPGIILGRGLRQGWSWERFPTMLGKPKSTFKRKRWSKGCLFGNPENSLLAGCARERVYIHEDVLRFWMHPILRCYPFCSCFVFVAGELHPGSPLTPLPVLEWQPLELHFVILFRCFFRFDFWMFFG